MRISKENYIASDRVKLLEPKWWRKINLRCKNCSYQIIDEPIWKYCNGDYTEFFCMTCAKEPLQAVKLYQKEYNAI